MIVKKIKTWYTVNHIEDNRLLNKYKEGRIESMNIFDYKKEIFPIQISQLPQVIPESLNTKIDEMIGNIFQYDSKSEEFNRNYHIFMQSFYQYPYI